MTAEHVFCQRCGDPVPKGVEPVDFTISKITNPAHPNVVKAARVNLWVKCPSCRKKIIIAVNYFNSVEDAQVVIDKAYEKIEKEKSGLLREAEGDNPERSPA